MRMPIMDQLHQDHINYVKLLSLLENYLEQQRQGSDEGYLEMYLIMNYMTRYPDIFHHPYEDIIFDELVNLDASLASAINNLLAEHERIISASRTVMHQLDAILNGHIVGKEAIRLAVAEYAVVLREHMNIEEGRVFPMINETMTQAAWDNIQGHLEHVKDPIFSDAVSDEFRTIYDQLDSASA